MTMIHAAIGVKSWLEKTPSVDEVRPPRCPSCDRASCPVGEQVVVQGHGLRERAVIFCDGPDAPAAVQILSVRRFRCTACKVTCTVLPADLAAHFRYALGVVCLALALWSEAKLSGEDVRQRFQILPPKKPSFDVGWPSLRRWCTWRGFLELGLEKHRPPRQRAHQIVGRVGARAPPQYRPLSIISKAFYGALHLM